MSLKLDQGGLSPGPSRLDSLWESLGEGASRIHWVTGPSGCGKTTELSLAQTRLRTVFWELPPVEGAALQADLSRLIDSEFGALPPSNHPIDPLRLRGDEAWWMMHFQQVFEALAKANPSVWVVDGTEALGQAGRHVIDLLIEAWAVVGQSRVHLILTSRELPASIQDGMAGEPSISLAGLPPIPMQVHRLSFQLPYRAAARLQGAQDPDDALLRWSILGGHPLFLPKATPEVAAPVADVVMGRILSPAGDLFDAPLKALQARVQNPARYLGLLAALARGDRKWGDLAKGSGVPAGNQLAPYLRRLEQEGWVRRVVPLDGVSGGRSRRYEITDPFLEFWMAYIFPWRSVLRQVGPARFYADFIVPALPQVVQRGLERVALAYMTEHARETLPAQPRIVGSLWAEGVEIALAARLANGQVCYGAIARVGEPADASLFHALDEAMRAVRWGIGREARAPLFFLPGPAEEGLRRLVARNPLARILGPDLLFDMEQKHA